VLKKFIFVSTSVMTGANFEKLPVLGKAWQSNNNGKENLN